MYFITKGYSFSSLLSFSFFLDFIMEVPYSHKKVSFSYSDQNLEILKYLLIQR